MQNLLNVINSKINDLGSNIDDLLYNSLVSALNEIKKDFRENKDFNLNQYFEKLNSIKTLRNKFVNNLDSHIPEVKTDLEYETKVSSDAISVSSTISQKVEKENIENRISTFTNVPENSFYFHNLNSDYGETKNQLSLNYSLTNLEDFKLFAIKISGLKLFDNIFLGRTIRSSMIKLMSFLFILNEKPFINLCKQNSKYFSTNKSNMKRPIAFKENLYFFESDVDDAQAAEMIKIFLNHSQIDLSACKVLRECFTSKESEHYITVVL